VSWERQPLGAICEIVSGITKDSKKQGDDYRDVPYLRVANVQRLRLDLSEVKTIPARESAIASYRLEPGDILLNEGGDRDKLGRGWIWQGQISECIHQNHVFRARIRNGKAIPKWVAYFANTDEARAYFLATGKQTTNLASISKKNLSALPVPLPPMEVQEEIVAEIDTQLSRLDETVATLQAIQAKLKQARASILKAAVEGRLVESEAETRWSTKPLRQLLLEPMRNGKSAKTSPNGKGIRIATLTAVTTNQFTELNTKPADLDPSKVNDLWMQPEDIFVQRSNAPDLVGTSAMYSGQPNWAIFPDLLIRVRCSPEILPKWMLANLQAPSTRRYFKENAKGSSGSMPKISQTTIAETLITCPSIQVQQTNLEELERRFSILDQVEATVTANLRRCRQLRQAVLKRAFSR
jgi:restriction endonuclease S subunit